MLVGLVLLWNIQCAAAFLLFPGGYAPGFELTGPPGEAAVRGLGVLFLMWNVPYAVALWHPFRYRVSLYQSLVMQGTGLLGETCILLSLPVAHMQARIGLLRFIGFDAAGLVLLGVAAWVVLRRGRTGTV